MSRTGVSASSPAAIEYSADESFALRLDQSDPLRGYRERFHLPRDRSGEPLIYFCGHSLGLQPKAARRLVEEELDDWAALGVEGHFQGRRPWYSYHELFRDSSARLVGARPGEVVVMNSLTVNLHLMMSSFFRPQGGRRRILMEWPAFPSDIYAIKSHLRSRGLDPGDALLVARPRQGEHVLRDADLEALIEEEGPSIALILLSGVNYFTGQLLDMARISEIGRRVGACVGFDLAHAAGNVPLRLHEWDVDFACWCSYKYLNAGPGAVAGCFVHERHARSPGLPRLAGWWGNDPDTRFRMHLESEFVPRPGADGWQISNPPILALAPLRASLDVFDEAGMEALRARSQRLTGYLRWLIERAASERYEIITPREGPRHGCQLSILVHREPEALFDLLQSSGAVGDYRPPNIIRVAPVPLYNTFHEVWSFARILASHAAS